MLRRYCHLNFGWQLEKAFGSVYSIFDNLLWYTVIDHRHKADVAHCIINLYQNVLSFCVRWACTCQSLDVNLWNLHSVLFKRWTKPKTVCASYLVQLDPLQNLARCVAAFSESLCEAYICLKFTVQVVFCLVTCLLNCVISMSICLYVYLSIGYQQGRIESFCQSQVWNVKGHRKAIFTHKKARTRVKY